MKVSPAPVDHIAEDCVSCGICVNECAFLQEYGSPKDLAENWRGGQKQGGRLFPFECSLCGLCHGVCPKKLDPSAMFLTMRRELVAGGQGILRQHKTIRAYEKRGSSSLFSFYYFPRGCTTVLFPGCAFPGTRPGTFLHLYQHLQQSIPNLGIVMDCCTKPSHDLGDNAHFTKMFSQLCRILASNSVTRVLVACPNCHHIFKEYGKGLEVESVYEQILGDSGLPVATEVEVTVHDPCGVRFSLSVQDGARGLLQQQGVRIREMKHKRQKTFCCGEGGAAGFVRPDFAKSWTDKRVKEADSDLIISYCAGCTQFLGEAATCHHLLDFLFFPQQVLEGRHKVSRPPFTYWNRFRLKRKLQEMCSAGRCGTRNQMTG